MAIDTSKIIKKLNIGSSSMVIGSVVSDVTLNLTNLIALAGSTIGSKNVSFTLVPNDGYNLPSSITFGTGITDGTYNSTTGEVSFTAPQTESNIEAKGILPPLTFTAEQEYSTVGYTIEGTVDTSGISYKLNDGEWTSWTDGMSITLVNIGDKIQVKNSNNTLSRDYTTDYFNFKMSGLISASENIDSMINYAPLSECCYAYMFFGCSSLTNAPDLPATTLANKCYFNMFIDCTGLTTIPELPATTLAESCYESMFSGCTGLTTIPELPATTLAGGCYMYMFQRCSSLTNVPSLPATTLTQSCYANMFDTCENLTTLPSNFLPATILAGDCYSSMFRYCINLINIPKLPATTLESYCYQQMFYGCSKIKLSTTQSAEYPNEYRIPYGEEEGVSAYDAMYNMFKNTGGAIIDPEINTTYYTSNEIK